MKRGIRETNINRIKNFGALKRRYFKLSRVSQSGVALVWALIFFLVVIATSAAISRKTLLGLVGSVFVRDSKLAREAAEIGVLRTLAVLNEPRNRRLLVNANDLNTKNSDELETVDYRSDCQPAANVPELQVELAALKETGKAEFPVVKIDGQRSYQIIAISQPKTSTQSDALFNIGLGTKTTAAQAGEITIKVRGLAFDGTKRIGESVVTRQLEVIPKCCGLSLGGKNNTFGPETRQCDAADPGLGLIAGTYTKNTGLFDTTGGSGITFKDDAGNPISKVYCIDNSDDNDCADSGINSGTGTDLVEVDKELPDVPSPSIAADFCKGDTTINCTVEIADDLTLSTSDFANWGGVTTVTLYGTTTSVFSTTVPSISTQTQVYQGKVNCTGPDQPIPGCVSNGTINVPGNKKITVISEVVTLVPSTSTAVSLFSTGTSTVASSPAAATLKSKCAQTTESGVTVTYCSLNRLEIAASKRLTFDTTGGPIRFYFPNKSTSSLPTIDLKNGNSALLQINSSKSPLAYEDLSLLGISRSNSTAADCPTGGTSCQFIELGGGNASTTSFFAYFPTGKVELFGTATVNGMIWANVIDATGSTNFVSSSSGVGSVLQWLYGSDSQDDGGNEEPLLVEYITRFTRRFRFF